MHTMLMIHTKSACTEYVLPKQRNGTYSIVLEGSLYDMKENGILTLESIKGAWYFSIPKGYFLKKKGYFYQDFSLQNGDIWELSFADGNEGEYLSIIVVQMAKHLPVFQKYIWNPSVSVTFGKNPDNTICYDFGHLVSGFHGVLEQKEDGIWIEDNSANGIFYQGERICGKRKLDYGAEITLFGLHILVLEDLLCLSGIGECRVGKELIPWRGQISRKGEKRRKREERYFHRGPRQIPVCNKEPLSICLTLNDALQREMVGKKGLSFLFSNRKRRAAKEKKLEELYDDAVGKIKERYEEHRKTLLEGYPSAPICCGYGRESTALWNRSKEQEDFSFVRLGLGERPFDVDIAIQGEKSLAERLHWKKEDFATLYKVPVGISLWEHRLWGVVGGKEKTGAYAVIYGMIAQILASYCYTEVKVGIIYNEQGQQDKRRWEFAKCFPHIWSGDGKQRYLAGNEEEAEELCYAWNRMLRKEEHPLFVLFLDSPGMYEKILQNNTFSFSQCGLTTFLLVENFQDLPHTCGNIIENTETFQGVYHTKKGIKERQYIDFDTVSKTLLTEFSKRLATIQVADNSQEGELPERLGFLEMYEADSVEDLQISKRWRNHDSSRSLLVPIGKNSDGRVCKLDVHEKQDGPHGLLAGTTGSGKSEVLLTYLLSLAVNYSPAEVAFVLIDFKGGGMAHLLEKLPHVTGSITNLSGSQIERGMLAIKSETNRRQKFFARYQISHISEYTYLWRHGQVSEEIPHLFLVVDEFAELKSQVPEFLEELIRVAQVGRSLGLHLILSTQKPSGTVNENIWSNSRFRLCLRVQTKEDSMEVLKRPDAAGLTGSGQGYLQIGVEERFEKFQGAYTGNPYQPGREKEVAVLLTKSGSRELLCKNRGKEWEENKKTELDVITAYLCNETLEEEFGRAKSLWLPPLSDMIFLEDLKEKEEEQNTKFSFHTAIGLCDAPEEQLQFPYQINFLEKGNYAVIGSVQSGRTTLVESLLLGLMKKYSTKEFHCYILDFNSSRLSVFESAIQTGGIVTMKQEEKLERFFSMMEEILKERREVLKEGNYTAYRREGGVLPAILVILDDFENFRQQTGDCYLDRFYRIMRDGNSLGIYVLITAGSFGIRGIPGFYREAIKESVALALPDKMHYEDALRRTGTFILPSKKKGRGLVAVGKSTLELQIALPIKEQEDYKRTQKLKEVLATLWSDRKEYLPKKIPAMPKVLALSKLDKQTYFMELLKTENQIPIGYDKVDAKPYLVSLEALDGYVISGKRKTGKKNLLQLFGILGKRKGIACIFFGKRHSRLESTVSFADGFITETEEWLTCFGQMEEERIKERFLLVEDMKDFFERIEEKGEISRLSDLILEGSKKGYHWIFAMNPEDYLSLLQFDVFSTIVEKEQGIHLGGRLNEQKIFHFENLSYREESVRQPAGIGMAADIESPCIGRTVLCIRVDEEFCTNLQERFREDI